MNDLFDMDHRAEIARNIVMEFPDYDDLALAGPPLTMRLVGSSWHNDVCPSLVTSDGKYKIFIDYKEPEKREDPDLPRFSLHQYAKKTDDYQFIMFSDDWNEIIEMVR